MDKRWSVIFLLVVLLQICNSSSVPCAQKTILETDTVSEEFQRDKDQTTLELTNAINAAYEMGKRKLSSGKTSEMEINSTLSFNDLEMLELTAEEQKMEEIKKEYETEYAKVPKDQAIALSNFLFLFFNFHFF